MKHLEQNMINNSVDIIFKQRISDSEIIELLTTAIYASHHSFSKAEARNISKDYLKHHAWKEQILKYLKHLLTIRAKDYTKYIISGKEIDYADLPEKTLNKVINFAHKKAKIKPL